VPELIEVRFKGNRKDVYTWENSAPAPLAVGDAVVVEAERGLDLGVVSAVGTAAEKKCGIGCTSCPVAPKTPKGRVVRAASPEDAHLNQELRKAEEDVRRKVIDRVRAHDLDMKVSDAEWQWDRRKLTVYFTADQRVDFRGLVRDLASLFRTRIDLRQIGARDEAKRLDGVGRCGRQYCCSSWLPELKPVSLALAKDQRLSLNPSQISGGCGRLLCCLRYEHEFYVASRKRFPKEGKVLRTARGEERVQAVDIFRERVLLRTEDGSVRSLALAELQAECGTQVVEPESAEPPAAAAAVEDQAEVEVAPPAEAASETTPRQHRRRRRRRRHRERRSSGPGGTTADPVASEEIAEPDPPEEPPEEPLGE
jgi:cell fate regulator YaaT (PSP1 superfamily)